MIRSHRFHKPLLVLGALVVGFGPGASFAREAIDWTGVDARTIPMFQPGQGSWEWLLIPANHAAGARRMREGRTCLSCHEGEEHTIGERIGSGQVLEPDPMPGMPGTFDLELKVTRDDSHLHLRLAWPASTGSAPRGESDVAARVTVMLGSDALPVAHVAGCWAACHNDMRDMPNAHSDQLTKYLPNSRVRLTATGGGTDVRSDAELAAELEAGRFLEYWQARLGETELTGVVDGYVLESRHRNESAALDAHARREGDRWVVEISRPLAPGDGAPRKELVAGTRYTIALAVHDNHYTHRHHYVSFPLDMMLDTGDADLIVTRP
jgi:hypothetical protein